MELHWPRLQAFRHVAVLAFMLAGPAQATELYDAARLQDVAKVVQLLGAGADPNQRSPYDGPLHAAVRYSPVEMVKVLLEAGADIELPGYGGAHPLHAAALSGANASVVYLIERGAKVDSLDNNGRSPLLSFVSGAVDDIKTLKVLLEYGADPNHRDTPYKYASLHYAAIQGKVDVAEILLAYGADVNAKDNIYGMTALHSAISNCFIAGRGHQDVVKILIDYGADVNVRDLDGLTPMDYAKRYAPNNGMLHHMLIKAGGT